MTVFFTYSIKLDEELLSKLRKTLVGEVITPRDETYKKARQAWNLRVNEYPALIVVARAKQDIIEAVCFAQEHSLKIAVQTTDDGIIRSVDDCLLIITENMNDV
jgi:hypothetical protein